MIRAAVALAGVIVVLGCNGESKTSAAALANARPSSSEEIVYVDLGSSAKLVKRFESTPDPAEYAEDPVSCRNAGGEWAEVYFLGVLILREPHEGADLGGKKCWSKRKPIEFADAGTPCRGQADCIGNCMASKQKNGNWSKPTCQAHAEDSTCGALYDGGTYHWIECPVS
jgi:hypothetical protein